MTPDQPGTPIADTCARTEVEPLAPTLVEELRALAQSQFDLSNDHKSREWQRKAHAHAWAGICAAIRVVQAHFAAQQSLAVPDDVAALVIAAREVAFTDQSADALKRLDDASEAFASRVPWDDEPADAPEEASPPQVPQPIREDL